MLPFHPKYRLGHPKIICVRCQRIYSFDQSIQNKIKLNFVKNFSGPNRMPVKKTSLSTTLCRSRLSEPLVEPKRMQHRQHRVLQCLLLLLLLPAMGIPERRLHGILQITKLKHPGRGAPGRWQACGKTAATSPHRLGIHSSRRRPCICGFARGSPSAFRRV